ncbi:hypothetical protein L596_001003 [Steinernema carpocapsae]|uniref:Uncharacterized protein n=1 Tax=Steinernema carpocapsae TaxID=34508 RepID=A0A4U8UKH9_STECR|nr:hypothetical protein L596_001003 [Steinernema carpocapsae]
MRQEIDNLISLREEVSHVCPSSRQDLVPRSPESQSARTDFFDSVQITRTSLPNDSNVPTAEKAIHLVPVHNTRCPTTGRSEPASSKCA